MMNFAVLLLLLAAFTFGCYTLWDTNQIFEEAYASNYAAYKPEAQKDNLSYDELVRRNPDVLGWLSIYGTGIDYPLVQAADNDLYLNRNALGEVSMPGSLFLDYRNQRGFQDFNTIIYGHHMEKSAMFGDISKFSEQQYFEERRYGDIYYGNVHYGLEILAILQCSAFNNGIYNPAVEGEGGKSEYLSLLYSQAVHQRTPDATPWDRIVLLSTCKTEPTDGRWILLTRITDEVYEDTFEDTGNVKAERFSAENIKNIAQQIPIWGYGLFVLFLVVLIAKAIHRKK